MSRPPASRQVRSPEGTTPGASALSPARGGVLLPVALILVGLGLAVFGVLRLTAEDPEVARLQDQIEAVEAETAAATADAEAAIAHEEAVRAAAVKLDDQLVALTESIEVVVETQNGVLDALQTWGEAGPYDGDQYGAELRRVVVPAVEAAEAATEDTLALFADVTAARAELDQLLENEGD